MKKLYYHGSVVLQEGRAACSMCGVEVNDNLLSENHAASLRHTT